MSSVNANLRFDVGLFHNNKINRIFINGPIRNDKSQVELGYNAFIGNDAPFPEIEITNFYSVVLREHTFKRNY